jgi:hypothetical protein
MDMYGDDYESEQLQLELEPEDENEQLELEYNYGSEEEKELSPREKYFWESSKGFSDFSAGKRLKFWDKMDRVEARVGKRLEEGYTRDDYLTLFSELNVAQIGAYYVAKCIIVKYLEWLLENKLAGDEINLKELQGIVYEDISYGSLIRGTLFKNFDHLQQKVEEAIATSNKPDDSIHDSAVALIYLAWYGATMDEAVSILKADVKPDEGCVYIAQTGRRIEMPKRVLDFLADYRDADHFVLQARRLIKLPYQESLMLMRTPKSPEITTQNAKNILSRFSKYGGETRFYYSRIRKSGIFNRVYAGELVNGSLVKNDYDKLAEVFGEDFKGYHDASDKLREYKGWKGLFYPTEQSRDAKVQKKPVKKKINAK